MDSTMTENGRMSHLGIFRPHLLELASSLNQMRSEDALTDVTVSVGDRHFRAHKAVLAASSQYFMAMFTSGFQESSVADVNIKEGTSDIMERLLEFAYTGIVNLNQECIIEILTMASYLQMKSAIDACTQYLREWIVESEGADVTWGNGIIFQVYLLAEDHEMVELKEFCWQHIVNNFVVLSKTLGFLKYVTVDLLSELLDRSDLTKPAHQKIPWHLQMSEMLGIFPAEAIATLMGRASTTKHTEQQILEAVVSWLNHDWKVRRRHAASLLKKVRLGVIPADSLESLLGTEKFRQLPECQELLSEVLGASPWLQKSHMFCSRGTITALIATGGTRIGNDGPFARHFYFNNQEVEETNWVPMLKFPKPADIPNIQDHTMAVLDGRLYLAGGGRHNDGGGRTMLESFFVYDSSVNNWLRLPDLLCGREGFAMVLFDGLIYTIGGWENNGDLRVFAETYNVADQTWDERDEQYVGCCDPCAIVYNNTILMYGHGINDGLPSDNVYYYDEDTDEDDFDDFTAAMSMDEQRDVRTSLHTLQMFDPAANKWYSLMQQRHYVHTAHGENEQYSALVVKNNKCYRVIYDKVRDRHCWVSKPRVNELILDLESSGPSAKLGKEEEQPWLPEYHVPGAFCIDREIYVNVNGCIINTGEKMPEQCPKPDKVNFSRWLAMDTPDMANAAVALFTFDHYNLTL